jgi:hypothetical protein
LSQPGALAHKLIISHALLIRLSTNISGT